MVDTIKCGDDVRMREVFGPGSGVKMDSANFVNFEIMVDTVDTDYVGMMWGEDEGSFRTR